MNLTSEMIDQRMKEHKRWQDTYSGEADRRGYRPHEVPQDMHLCRECGKSELYGGYCEEHARGRMKA